jgi:hypothetical protein
VNLGNGGFVAFKKFTCLPKRLKDSQKQFSQETALRKIRDLGAGG